jgi:formate dehydrogenase major subunit
MTRRAPLDVLEPGPIASVSRGTIARLGIAPGDIVRVSTRHGTIELAVRQDDGVPDGIVYIPFAFVETAANLLTNPALGPFGPSSVPSGQIGAAGVAARAGGRAVLT